MAYERLSNYFLSVTEFAGSTFLVTLNFLVWKWKSYEKQEDLGIFITQVSSGTCRVGHSYKYVPTQQGTSSLRLMCLLLQQQTTQIWLHTFSNTLGYWFQFHNDILVNGNIHWTSLVHWYYCFTPRLSLSMRATKYITQYTVGMWSHIFPLPRTRLPKAKVESYFLTVA